MSDLVGNPEDRFSRVEANMVIKNLFEPQHEKTNIVVSDHVELSPDCIATDDG